MAAYDTSEQHSHLIPVRFTLYLSLFSPYPHSTKQNQMLNDTQLHIGLPD